MKAVLSGSLVAAALLLLGGCADKGLVVKLTNGEMFGSGQSPLNPDQEPFLVKLSAADFDRAGEVITFKMPAGLPRGEQWLWDAWGSKAVHPLQVDENDTATALIPFQKAGETLTFVFRPVSKYKAEMVYGPAPGHQRAKWQYEPLVPTNTYTSISVTKEDGRLCFNVNGSPVFYYQMALAKPPRDGLDAKIWRGAFLYPIFTPKGVQVSDSYPVDHPHDHGIWTAWASSEFQGRPVDFWNPHYPDGGTVEFAALDRTWEGPVDAGFESLHRFMDRTVTPPMAALNEKWKVTLYAAPGLSARMFDLEFYQTPATADPLQVLKYQYGGLGVRGNAQWEDKSDLTVLTSEGIADRVQANNKPARWFFMGGNIDGAPAGIAVLSSPDNFRSPQTVRMNPDGPFFMYAPEIASGFAITKEQPYIAHYRFIVQDGPPDAKFLEACWQGFAHPATVTVTAR